MALSGKGKEEIGQITGRGPGALFIHIHKFQDEPLAKRRGRAALVVAELWELKSISRWEQAVKSWSFSYDGTVKYHRLRLQLQVGYEPPIILNPRFHLHLYVPKSINQTGAIINKALANSLFNALSLVQFIQM